MVRRFGPTLGAGVVVEEQDAQPSITPASLGNVAYTGIMRKGPVGKIFRCGTRTEFLFRAGGIIDESLLPDAALAFYRRGRGAGAIYANRITDGTEEKASLSFMNRKSVQSSTMKVHAGNAGRWAGKKLMFVREYLSITATTLQLDNPPSMKEDELVGAVVQLAAVPGRSYEVIANSDAGELTFAPDADLITDVGASTNKVLSVDLGNGGDAIGIKITESTANPASEWRMEVWFIEGGIGQLVKEFDNLSSDPTADNYYKRVINDQSDADFTISVDDENIGAVVADTRPANLYGESMLLTATQLTVDISQTTVNSAVVGLVMKARDHVLGGSVMADNLTLTNLVAGARSAAVLTFGANPADDDTVSIGGVVLTFKATVADPTTEVLIGADAEATLDNLVAFLAAGDNASLKYLVFGEKATASTMNLFASTPGVAGDAIATPAGTGATPPTWGAVTLTGGADQTWSVASEQQAYLTLPDLTAGVAYAPASDFSLGFTLMDCTKDSTKLPAPGDTALVQVAPLQVNALQGGSLLPVAGDFRNKFPITSNTANVINVKTGSDMTTVAGAQTGGEYRAEYVQQLAGGYDGIVGVGDLEYQNAYDPGSSPLKAMRGKNLGLVKLATPGVTSTTVQKAGVAFAESQNWQYRYEVPASILSESAAEEYVSETLGKNVFAAVSFPTYAYTTHPSGNGLKLVSEVGEIHGAEADVARNFNGYHKAAAGVDVTLPDIVKLPGNLGEKEIDQELLNPKGIGMILSKGGNFVLWGDRIPTNDPGFVFKHHRELLSHYENIFLENFDFIIFAINQVQTQTRAISAFVSFFVPEFAKGAVRGDSVLEAINLKIDDENNTDATRAAGDMFAELSPRLADTVERFIIKISKRGVEEFSA